MKRKLIKFSNYSFCLTLPKFAVEELGWKKGEEVEVEFDEAAKTIHIFKGGKSTAKSEAKTEKPVKSEKAETKSSEDIQPIPKLRW